MKRSRSKIVPVLFFLLVLAANFLAPNVSPHSAQNANRSPDVVIMLTDYQDVLLLTYMPWIKALLAQ